MYSLPLDMKTLFWRQGEVLIRRDDREQCSMQLTTRVIEARAPGSNILKVTLHPFLWQQAMLLIMQ